MDTFRLIQKFFARMTCEQCKCPYEPAGIQLIREEDGLYVVSVYCNQCQQQMGVAMVGVETRDVHENDPALGEEHLDEYKSTASLHAGMQTLRQGHSNTYHRYAAYDPELTPSERRRLADFAPISQDDVIDAHQFFKNLDASWSTYLPTPIQTFKPDLPEKTSSEMAVQNVPEA
jgi:hypothetical protein